MVERPMRRNDKQIGDEAELMRILDEAMVLRLGLVDDGVPYIVPVNFGRDGAGLWVHSAQTGRKLECLRASPVVCVEADRFIRLATGDGACGDWTTHYESVVGVGDAELVADPDEKLQGLRAIMRKYSGRDDWSFAAPDVARTAVIRIRLRRLTGKQSPARPDQV